MRDVPILKVIVFALQSALHEVVRVVNEKGEEFSDEGGQEEYEGGVVSVSELLLQVGL